MSARPNGWLVRSLRISGLVCALVPCARAAGAQEIRLDPGIVPPPARAGHVGLDTESATVDAGRPGWIELRFHVDPGFHINSHTPHDETLIPTSLQLDNPRELRLLRTEFPEGTPFHLAVGSGETLSTYQGGFRVRLQITAPAHGETTLTGRLHYQACDSAACFPPRDLPVRVALIVR